MLIYKESLLTLSTVGCIKRFTCVIITNPYNKVDGM